jgi:hypothetical protein
MFDYLGQQLQQLASLRTSGLGVMATTGLQKRLNWRSKNVTALKSVNIIWTSRMHL